MVNVKTSTQEILGNPMNHKKKSSCLMKIENYKLCSRFSLTQHDVQHLKVVISLTIMNLTKKEKRVDMYLLCIHATII